VAVTTKTSNTFFQGLAQTYNDPTYSYQTKLARGHTLSYDPSYIPTVDVYTPIATNDLIPVILYDSIDVTSNYNIAMTYGTISIDKYITVCGLTDGSLEKVYDGIDSYDSLFQTYTLSVTRTVDGTKKDYLRATIEITGIYSEEGLINELNEVLHAGTYYLKTNKLTIHIYSSYSGDEVDVTNAFIDHTSYDYITLDTLSYQIERRILSILPKDVTFDYDAKIHTYEDYFKDGDGNYSAIDLYQESDFDSSDEAITINSLLEGDYLVVETTYSASSGKDQYTATSAQNLITRVSIYDSTNTLLQVCETTGKVSNNQASGSLFEDYYVIYDYYKKFKRFFIF
jgi:hypothetical protein